MLQLKLGRKPETKILMLLMDAAIAITAGSCAWVMIQYEQSPYSNLTQGNRHFELWQLSRVSSSERAKLLLTGLLTVPSPPTFAAAVLLYSASISALYCIHRDEEYLDTWLGVGVCVAFAMGLLSEADIPQILVKFLPVTVLISLLMSVLYCHCCRFKGQED